MAEKHGLEQQQSVRKAKKLKFEVLPEDWGCEEPGLEKVWGKPPPVEQRPVRQRVKNYLEFRAKTRPLAIGGSGVLQILKNLETGSN